MPPSPKPYVIAEAGSREYLEREVVDLIRKGYVPVGGVAVTIESGDKYNPPLIWAQAMILVDTSASPRPPRAEPAP